MSHKLLVKDQKGEREVVLVDVLAVGRDPHCDITAPDPLLSRRHAEFVASGQTVVVRDLDSRNGILVNGRRLTEAVLHPGDVVQISQLVVTVVSRVEADTVLAPAAVADGAEEKTSLLSDAEIQAVAAASAPAGRNVATGMPQADGNGARKSGAWSVQLVGEDDRTNLVPPPVGSDAGRPTGAGKPAPALAATISGPAIQPLPLRPVGEAAAAAQRSPVAAARGGARAAIVARSLALAVVCFTLGVASTMIWLRPPLTARWLLFDHAPLAVVTAFICVLVAGGVVGVVIGKTAGRAEPN